MSIYEIVTFVTACVVTWVLWVWIVGLVFGSGYLIVVWTARRFNQWRRS